MTCVTPPSYTACFTPSPVQEVKGSSEFHRPEAVCRNIEVKSAAPELAASSKTKIELVASTVQVQYTSPQNCQKLASSVSQISSPEAQKTVYRRPPRPVKTQQIKCTVIEASPGLNEYQIPRNITGTRTRGRSLTLLDSASQCPPKAYDTRRQIVDSLGLPVGVEAGIGSPKGRRRRHMSLTLSGT
nr:unnamed protein product [Spirometra erinaceieuropaei]